MKAETPHDSPWRALMIGRQPGRLVESDLVSNLSTPCQIEDSSWIRPGMMAWDHWWSGDVNAEHLDVEDRTVTSAETVTLRLAPAGGCVARLQEQ